MPRHETTTEPAEATTLGFPEAGTVPAAPKKPRKARAKKAAAPKPEKAKRTRGPVRTLLARVREMGEHHAEAYRVLRNDEFEAGLRAELAYDATFMKARFAVTDAKEKYEAAKAVFDRFPPKGTAFSARLDALAVQIGEAKRTPVAPPA